MKKYYYIGFDDNGSPYVAHAMERSGAHKYLMKIMTASGPRYFYTQEEIKAYYTAMKKINAGIGGNQSAMDKISSELSKRETDKWDAVKDTNEKMNELRSASASTSRMAVKADNTKALGEFFKEEEKKKRR